MTGIAEGRRSRARAATVDEIKAVAREQLARAGSSSINLRAVARQMGITPSALYRYFASRDDILTALIADAYNDLGGVVEASVASLPATDGASRFLTAAGAFRTWALSNPAEFALLYGSPVPGYTAPPEVTGPAAMRTTNVLLHSLKSALDNGTVTIPFGPSDMPVRVRSALAGITLTDVGENRLSGPDVTAVAMMAWTALVGFLVTEVFSHWPPAMAPAADAFFDFSMRRVLLAIGTDPEVTVAARLATF